MSESVGYLTRGWQRMVSRLPLTLLFGISVTVTEIRGCNSLRCNFPFWFTFVNLILLRLRSQPRVKVWQLARGLPYSILLPNNPMLKTYTRLALPEIPISMSLHDSPSHHDHTQCCVDHSHHETSFRSYNNRGYHASGQGIISINHLNLDPPGVSTCRARCP
jgi:hypothetical protein